MIERDDEDELLRSVATQNATAIRRARDRMERELVVAKDELRESAERLTLALSAGRLGDWSWDARSDVVTLGARASEIFDVSRGEHLTWSALREKIHPEDRERARLAVERAAAERALYDSEYRIHHADGQEFWIAAKGRGTYTEDGSLVGMIGVVQDVSERKRTEQALKDLLESEQLARAETERLSAMKDEFLATLSHELRTPLSAILGWAQVLQRRAPSEAELRHAVEIIERNARMQVQLIEDLLDMSRITSGQLRLDIQPVVPASFIEAAVETVRPAVEAKGIRLETVLDPFAGPLHGDPNRLQQVVWNLLSNAVKFTPKGGKVQVLLRRVDSHVEIAIADTGIGIHPDFADHVFERFRQADALPSRQQGGLGIGLSIVKHLVELHGGTVRCHSPGENRGATFTVLLPLAVIHRSAADEPRARPTSQRPAEEAMADLRGIKVLVVDDESDGRKLIQRLLIDCGAQVLIAASAEEALALVERERPDVLVTDIGMPGVDGYELLRRVRGIGDSRGGRIPAIALTAFARSQDRTRALRAGFRVHIAKPVEPSELVATVASVVGRTGEVA